MRAIASVLLLSASLAVAGCGSSDKVDQFGLVNGTSPAPDVTPPAMSSAAQNGPAPVSTSPSASSPSAPATAKAPKITQGVCATVEAAPSRTADVPKPQGKLDVNKDNLVTLNTSCGKVVVQLDPKDHPITANAVAWMVSHKYYDDTAFHRIFEGFVVQGGDPTGTGSGGPTWKLTEAPPADQTYPEGTFAMAKGGAEPSGTIGSQFFIMTGGTLDPSYAVAGKVISGMDAVHAMEKLGQGPGSDGPPNRPINTITATFSAK